MAHLKGTTKENVIRMWAGKQQEMRWYQYHCQLVANMEGGRVLNTLISFSHCLLISCYCPPSAEFNQKPEGKGTLLKIYWGNGDYLAQKHQGASNPTNLL